MTRPFVIEETVSAINFSGSSVSGTTYKWTNDNPSIGLAASGTGNISSFTGTNTSNDPITANITVTPVANGCEGTPQNFNITVNPTATVNKPGDQTVCNEETVSAINFSGSSVSGTTYKWTNDNPSIGLAASGTGNISSFTGTNTSNDPITANITVTPIANGCEGTPQNFSITVNPTATVNKPGDQTVCNQEAVSAINFSGSSVSGTTYKWTNDNTSIGLAASGTGNISSFTGTNTSNDPITANITITPVANGCEGTPQNFSITVNPTATVNKPGGQTVCNEGTVSAISFSGSSVSGTTYNWTNDNTSIGLAASGTGNISSFTGTNTSNDPITANITVTPTANGCEGTPQNFSITVNPTATVNKPGDQTVCNEGTVSAINFSGSSVSGTTYNWTNDKPSIGLAASGTGNISSFSGTNTSNDPITANITVTPVANGCEGTPQNFSITVNPSIEVDNFEVTQVICKGDSNGTITIGVVTGGNGNFQYSMDNINFGSTKTFSNLTVGTYTIYIKDSQSCSFEQEISITEPDELEIFTPSTSLPVSCFGGFDGKIQIGEITGGNSPYKYSLDNETFDDTTVFTGLEAGTYTLFIKDTKGCALQETVTVEQPAVLEATINKNNMTCFESKDGEIYLTELAGGNGSYEFSIDGSNWYEGSETISVELPGEYTVFLKDPSISNCSVTLGKVDISEPQKLQAEATTTPTSTYGSSTGSATVNASGGTSGYTYEWRRIGDPSFMTTTRTANNLSAGEYEVTVTDSNGCEVVVSPVTIRDAVFAEIESATMCEGENIQDNQVRTAYFRVADLTALGGFGNYKYIWDFGEGKPTTTGPGLHAVTYTTSGNKTITLTITDKDDQGNVFQTITLTQQQYVGLCHEPCGQAQNAQFDVDAIYIGDINGNPLPEDPDACDEATPKYLFLPVSKNVNMYNPYTEVTFITTNGFTDQFETQTDTGCKDEDQIDEIPESENSKKPNRVGEFIRLTANPIEYNCGDGLQIEGFYITYTNTTKKDCLSNNKGFCYSINDPVVVPTPVYVEATPTPINCKGENTGMISAKGTGGFAPYMFNITGEDDAYDTPRTFYDLSAGQYTVYIKDSRGNKNSTTVTIIEPETSLSAEVATTPPLCFGKTGTATVSVISPEGVGTPFGPGALENDEKYKYLWNDPAEQTTATATNLTAGEYTVTVTDANGCQEIKTVIITQPEPITEPQPGPGAELQCGINNIRLQANNPNTAIGEVGTWRVISGQSETDFGFGPEETTTSNDPNALFTATAGEYQIVWEISNTNQSSECAITSEPITVSFQGNCSKLNFDGVDDYITMGDNYNFPSGGFSIEAWVKPQSLSGVKTILSKRNSSNLAAGGYDLIINNGAPTFRWQDSENKSQTVTTSYKINTDRWFHLAVNFDGSKATLFVDGLSVGTRTGKSPLQISAPFLIGAMYNSNTPEIPKNFFHGFIEEVRIWEGAISSSQIRFFMNQRLKQNGTKVEGEILQNSMELPNAPTLPDYSKLLGYYQLLAIPDLITNGFTKNLGSTGTTADGHLKNIQEMQENTAPLPYILFTNSGNWFDNTTWQLPQTYHLKFSDIDFEQAIDNNNVWNSPNSKGVNGDKIQWNIVKLNGKIVNNPASADNISLLALLDGGGKLDLIGENNTSGTSLTISHYLELDGFIDLNGESQLLQTEGSKLSGTGYIERDQQGTASSYNYNYWSSPVSTKDQAPNSGYKIGEKDNENNYLGVLYDGSDPDIPGIIDFNYQYHYADHDYPSNNPIKISSYWLNKFFGGAGQYSNWEQISIDSPLATGEGFTMKGSRGNRNIKDLQNYTFKGIPNNGTITLNIGVDQNYLIGNPYPSAIDANKFIKDNLKDVTGGTNSKNVFNGSIYFWSHFAEKTHYLTEYVGGYAIYNLSGGVRAIANDARIDNSNPNRDGGKKPRQYIPVGQGFFVNTVLDPSLTLNTNVTISGGEIQFNNAQRVFITEIDTTKSVFHSVERKDFKHAAFNSGKLMLMS